MFVHGIRMLTKFLLTPNYEKRRNFLPCTVELMKKQRNSGTHSYNNAKGTVD